MREPTHKLYLDDSGNKEYRADATYPASGGVTWLFVFGGFIVARNDAGTITTAVRKLKQACFGTPMVEIKANWLKRPQERSKRYVGPYGITDERLTAFVDDLYKLIVTFPIKMIACVVNKEHCQKMYGLAAHYAPAIAYDCVQQRVKHEMDECKGFVHTTIDDMDGATPKGYQYRANLERHHQRLRLRGSAYQSKMVFDKLGELDFTDSATDERVQVADLVAHNVYKQFVLYGDKWERKERDLPEYDYFSRIASKFRMGPNNRVQGFGIVKFPLTQRVKWCYTQ